MNIIFINIRISILFSLLFFSLSCASESTFISSNEATTLPIEYKQEITSILDEIEKRNLKVTNITITDNNEHGKQNDLNNLSHKNKNILLTFNVIHETNLQEKNSNQNITSKLDDLIKKQAYFSFADHAALALSAVSTLVTIFGIGIAIFSFIGYNEIKKITVRKAEETANDTITNSIAAIATEELGNLIRQGVFNDQLSTIVDQSILRSAASTTSREQNAAFIAEIDALNNRED
ncbi:hypothetical protein PMAL9190_01506 [Photobacterium malacitanum]|uniref:Lipoprotein n=1 Tax=Photobacterium malacitanum TaxID=2204294 RepID=A0A1Y6MEC8_9GAMM|nr:hypothetical protein [Photobacterium malacitanum]SMY34120.1 hypothetical protein PMAL9190_01506 [Photobacterium malacitanum]